MKMPRKPPDIDKKQFTYFSSPEKFDLIRTEGMKTEKDGKYRHWDILRHLSPPEGLNLEEWWCGIKMRRMLGYKSVPLCGRDKKDFFFYNITETVQEELHQIDLGTGGVIKAPESIVNHNTRDQYLVHSIIQEAITSSQIEGATTTRRVAKEMLRSGRAPQNTSERMILNNFYTMQKIREWKEFPLSKDLVFEI